VRAIDPRLGQYARATKTFLVISVCLGSLSALLIVAQAWLLAEVVTGALYHHESFAQLQTPLAWLLGVVAARAVLAWAAELAAGKSSAEAKSQLRGALLEQVAQLGTDSSRSERSGEVAVLATRGVDALDGYFSLYLPQLLLAAIVPVVVLAAIFSEDWISGAIVALTIPLIPLFMALVGASTREKMDRQVRTLERLGGHFLDVVAGLPTLKVFGRAKAQAARIEEVSERYRTTALATLKVTFLSSLILELVATISVALVAVAIGLRLMGGELALQGGLFVLVLAPEAYLPLRKLGANYHASAEGMAAAEQVFALIEEPSTGRAADGVARGLDGLATQLEAPDMTTADIEVEGLTVVYEGRPGPALEDVSLSVQAGEIVALAGPSGCGKSTLLSVLLGFTRPTSGSVRVGGVSFDRLALDSWRERVAWVPQRPHLFGGSIAENVRIGRGEASDEDVEEACVAVGLGPLLAKLPDGIQTRLGERGSGISAGERQRVGLARAWVRDAQVLLLDEPTANLDGESEREVLEATRRLAEGRTAIVVAHRPALLELADRVVELGAEVLV
jgi:ATP-binding cassette, subfamily C, bacterial CydCD